MNILIITPGFHPVPAFEGGAIEGLVQSYIESNKSNNITVYSIKPRVEYSDEIKKYQGVEFRYVSFEKFSRNNYIKQIKKDIINRREQNKFDVVIVENIALYCIYLRRLFKGKIVLHLHNDYLNKNVKLAKFKYKCCDEVWCVSQFIADRVNEIDINNKKAKLLYNGIDVSKFNKENLNKNKINELKSKYSISEKGKVFLYTGRIIPEKGVLELVKAFNILQNEKKDVFLLIVGGDKNYTNKQDCYVERVKKESTGNIIFTGNVDRENIPYYYGVADYQIVPSLWNEAFGLIIVEGMACGLPVIATKVGGIPEIVNSSNGILINKENIENELVSAMKEILTKNVNEYSKQSIATAKNFNDENYKDRVEKLLVEFKKKNYKITLFSEYTKTDLNAGPKAKIDVEKILQENYDTKIAFMNFKPNQNKFCKLFYKIKKVAKIVLNSDKKRIAIIQFPFVKRGYKFFKHYKKVIVLIHDIEGIRHQDEEILRKEIKFLNKCDAIILHNEKMKKELVSKGLKKEKIYILGIFDYLCINNKKEYRTFKKPTVVYAGNLKKEKSPFIYQLEEEKIEFLINLYGVGLQEDINERIQYKGSYLPDELPMKLQGDLGLVWDGNYDESDENKGYKNYTKYNNPHKFSCYMAAGIPVIVWRKSAMADFVNENKIGYTISSIYDINNIDFSDYLQKAQNTRKISEKIKEGYFTIKILDEIMSEMNN